MLHHRALPRDGKGHRAPGALLLGLVVLASVTASQVTFELEPDVRVGWDVAIDSVRPATDQPRDMDAAGGRVFVLQESFPQPEHIPIVRARDGATGTLLWSSSYEPSEEDAFFVDANLLAAAPDGSVVYVVLSYRLPAAGVGLAFERVVRVLAYDGADGTVLWDADFPFLDPLGNTPLDLLVSVDGSLVYMAGRVSVFDQPFGGESARDGYVLALSSADGSVAWAQGYDGPDGLYDSTWHIAQDPAGTRLFAALEVDTVALRDECVVVAYDAVLGTVLWEEFYGSVEVEDDRPTALVSDGSSVFLGAETFSAPTLAILDASTGALQGSDDFGGVDLGGLALSPDAMQLVGVGHAEGSFDLRVESLALVPGAPEWVHTLTSDSDSDIDPVGVAFDSTGARVVAAARFSTGGDTPPAQDLLALGLDAATGAQVWAEFEPDDTLSTFPVLLAMVEGLSGSNAVILGRFLQPFEGYRVGERVFETSVGALAWSVVETGPVSPGLDDARHVVLSEDGSRSWVAIDQSVLTSTWFDNRIVVREVDVETGETVWETDTSDDFDTIALLDWPGQNRVCLVARGDDAYAAFGVDRDTGVLDWSATWEGGTPFGDLERPKDAVVAPDGSALYVTGYTRGFGGLDYFGTVAWDGVTGDVLWSALLNFSAQGETGAEGITVAPDGSTVYVTGFAFTGSGQDVTTVAYDATDGQQLWVRVVDQDLDDRGDALVLSEDGARLYPVGRFWSPTEEVFHFGSVALNAQTGSVFWTEDDCTVPFDSSGTETLVEARLSPDGSVLYYVGAGSLRFGERAARVAAVDAATGACLWTTTLEGPGDFTPVGMDLTADGRALHLLGDGVTDGPGPVFSSHLIALDAATGGLLWSADRVASDDEAAELDSTDRYVLALGNTRVFGLFDDASLVRYDLEALQSAPGSVSLAAGGEQTLQLTAPEELAGSIYWVAGSASGTSPGLGIAGQQVPLVFDSYFVLSLLGANVPPFVSTFRGLDSEGKGTATIALPAGLDPSLAGAELNHALIVLVPGVSVELVSQASPLLLVP